MGNNRDDSWQHVSGEEDARIIQNEEREGYMGSSGNWMRVKVSSLGKG